MSTHNIGFYEDLTKIIFQLSSNMHLISSSEEMMSSRGGEMIVNDVRRQTERQLLP